MDTSFNFRIDKLDALTCLKGRRHNRVMDTKVQGLGMRVLPSGAKTFVFYRRLLPDNNESPRKIVEFTYGDVSIEQARMKATELNHLVGRGKDPSLAEPEPPLWQPKCALPNKQTVLAASWQRAAMIPHVVPETRVCV